MSFVPPSPYSVDDGGNRYTKLFLVLLLRVFEGGESLVRHSSFRLLLSARPRTLILIYDVVNS